MIKYEVNGLEKIQIEFKNKNGDPEVYCDEKMIDAVIRNLLSNAIKFTPDSGSIYIVGRAVGDAIDLIIQDTGIGIPEEQKKTIFKKKKKI